MSHPALKAEAGRKPRILEAIDASTTVPARAAEPSAQDRAIVRWACLGAAAVVITILAVSLDHLASGITYVTGGEIWAGWAMAVAIDLGMIIAEVTTITLGRLVPSSARYASRYVGATIVISAALNVLGFWPSEPDRIGMALAVVLGCGIPAGVWHLVRSSGELWMWAYGRSAD